MVGRPGRKGSKGSEASTSQDGETPKSVLGKRQQGRPRKSVDESSWGSRDSTPFSPANPPAIRGRTTRGGARLVNRIEEFDAVEDFRSHRLAKYIAEHPDSREEFAKLLQTRPSFPSWIHEEDEIEHDGTVYQAGDIVCLFCEDDEQEGVDVPYYAQIRSLIHDSFKRPYAWITWLVPSINAPDKHDFEPEFFHHSLEDHKLHELSSLRWECGCPDLPEYQNWDEPRAAVDRARIAQMRERREALLKAVEFEMPRGLDVVRAGDVKLAHTKEHRAELEEVLNEARERDAARRAEFAKQRKEEKAGENTEKKEEYKSPSPHLGSSPLRSEESGEEEEESDDEDKDDDDDEEGVEGAEDGEREKKVARMRTRTGSQTSVTSKGTVESVDSAATKPMEEE